MALTAVDITVLIWAVRIACTACWWWWRWLFRFAAVVGVTYFAADAVIVVEATHTISRVELTVGARITLQIALATGIRTDLAGAANTAFTGLTFVVILTKSGGRKIVVRRVHTALGNAELTVRTVAVF